MTEQAENLGAQDGVWHAAECYSKQRAHSSHRLCNHSTYLPCRSCDFQGNCAQYKPCARNSQRNGKWYNMLASTPQPRLFTGAPLLTRDYQASQVQPSLPQTTQEGWAACPRLVAPPKLPLAQHRDAAMTPASSSCALTRVRPTRPPSGSIALTQMVLLNKE